MLDHHAFAGPVPIELVAFAPVTGRDRVRLPVYFEAHVAQKMAVQYLINSFLVVAGALVTSAYAVSVVRGKSFGVACCVGAGLRLIAVMSRACFVHQLSFYFRGVSHRHVIILIP